MHITPEGRCAHDDILFLHLSCDHGRPFIAIRHRIRNRFIRSFLYYIPYAVLTAMTIPAIFTATGSVWSASAGLLVAIILALRKCSLTTVALAACLAVYLVELIV